MHNELKIEVESLSEKWSEIAQLTLELNLVNQLILFQFLRFFLGIRG